MKGFGPGFSSARGARNCKLQAQRHQRHCMKQNEAGPRQRELTLPGLVNHDLRGFFTLRMKSKTN